MSQWNERSNHLKPNQRDHFSEGVRFSRWIEIMKSEERHKERKDNEKHRDTERDTEAGGE